MEETDAEVIERFSISIILLSAKVVGSCIS